MKVLEIFTVRSDKHVPHEEGMIGTSAHDTDIDPVTLVPSCVPIDDIDSVPGVEIVNSTLAVDLPYLVTAISMDHDVI